MLIKSILTAMVLLFPNNAFGGEPRTLHSNLVKAVPSPVTQTQCQTNPVVWEIPARHNQVTISYLSKNDTVIFERDFSVEGSNKIRIRSRKEDQ